MTLPTGIRGQLVAIALLLIVLLLAYQFVALPAFSAYEARQESIADTQRAVRRYRQLLAQAPALEAFSERFRSQSPLAALLLPGDNPALSGAALQQRLQDLARQYDVRVLSLRIRPTEEDGRFERVGVEVRMQSDMTGLRDLLYEIEQSTPYLFVDSLAVRTRPQRRRGTVAQAARVLDTRLVVSGLRSPGVASPMEPGR
jgi:general secretion pathway protein M